MGSFLISEVRGVRLSGSPRSGASPDRLEFRDIVRGWQHVVETLSANYKVGVSVCVFGVIFPHTWGKMKLLSNILAPVCCVTVAEGTQLWKRTFSIFCLEKEKIEKKNSRELRQREESDRFRRTQCPVAKSEHSNPERHDCCI
jgi:hypothetical protein